MEFLLFWNQPPTPPPRWWGDKIPPLSLLALFIDLSVFRLTFRRRRRGGATTRWGGAGVDLSQTSVVASDRKRPLFSFFFFDLVQTARRRAGGASAWRFDGRRPRQLSSPPPADASQLSDFSQGDVCGHDRASAVLLQEHSGISIIQNSQTCIGLLFGSFVAAGNLRPLCFPAFRSVFGSSSLLGECSFLERFKSTGVERSRAPL